MQTWLVTIPLEECEDLLAASTLGRLAVILDGRPEIFPVNHVFDRTHGCVAFPTNVRTKLQAALDWPWVAYEVDDVEPAAGGGWSVMVVGRAEEVTNSDEIRRLTSMRYALWRSGESVRWLRIIPSKVTGRRIKAVVASPRR